MRIYLKIHPRSSKNEIIEKSANEYEALVTAPPVKGEANTALIKLLAEHFKVSKSQVNIVGGKTSKTKIVDIIK